MTNVQTIINSKIDNMKSSKLSNLIKGSILVVICIGVFIAKAFIKLPIPQRAINAQGLYTFLNEIQFKETAIFTFLIILYVAFKWLKIRLNWAFTLAIGATCGNLGLMMIDARYQSYDSDIETHIINHYGTPMQIFSIAGLLLAIAVMVGLISMFAKIEDENLSNRQQYQWHYRLGYFGLVIAGFYFLLFVSFY